jgi:copper(I)-binding protein
VRAPVAPAVLGLAVAGLTVLTACSSSGSGSAGHSSSPMVPRPALASAALGALVVTGGYIPEPASPDVASAYLTITNNGDTADKLTRVSTSVTSDVMAMNETDSGGVGSMTDLADVTIPAHASMQFVPNHAHLMLEKPKPLKVGDQVSMTLTFTPAGTVTITLPVLALDQTPTSVPTQMTMAPTTGSASSTKSSMPGMPGMSMPGS